MMAIFKVGTEERIFDLEDKNGQMELEQWIKAAVATRNNFSVEFE